MRSRIMSAVSDRSLTACFHCRRPQVLCKQTMKRVHGPLAANTVAASVERAAAEAALHLLADADVLQLNLVRNGDALGDAPAGFLAFYLGEPVIENNTAAIRPQRQHAIGVH